MSHGELSGDEEYDFEVEHDNSARRYPVHDCCEFEDVETLKNLLYIALDEDSSTDDNKDKSLPKHEGHHESSSSDDNDSTAAAHAAAIGHSPQPIKAIVDPSLPTVPEHLIQPSFPEKKVDKYGGKDESAADDGPKKPSEADTDSTPAKANEAATEKESSGTTRKGESTTVDSDQKDSKGTHNDSEAQPMDVDEENARKELNGDASGEADSPKRTSKTNRLELDADINLNERDEDDNTALHVAVHCRKLDHVKLLLEAGASFRIRCDGSLLIHTAISIGALRDHRQFAYECVVLLHEHGADLTVKDDSVHTPLFLACMVNLPQVASYILSQDDGLTTLNMRADRAGNRPLHAAAKFDTPDNPSLSRRAASFATGQARSAHHHHLHHPDGSVNNSVHPIPGLPGKAEEDSTEHHGNAPSAGDTSSAAAATQSTEALLTQVLLGTSGAEVDALNVLGQTALHIACSRGNWPVARLLLHAGASATIADRHGYTPGQLAYKRAMPIPNDLLETLGDPPESGIVAPLRELIVDPDASTLLLCHELCMLHRTCAPIERDSAEPPPENVRRLHVLVDPVTGILRSGEFGNLVWKNEARRAAIADILKIHEYMYVERVSMMTSAIPDHPNAIAHLDGDTAVSRWSFEAAMRAAGSVCEAVDYVVAGDNIRNAFCAVRPPGHHAGPRGIVRCANDPEGGSHGFCLFNNVCIGAAYARCMYRNEGIKKVAIVDFDVHHGNGTEEVIRNLVPGIEKGTIRTPFAFGEMSTTTYRPWLDETDIQNVFFSSTHGYGNRGYEQPGWFYPASGKTHTSEAISHPAMVENPNTSDFILSQTWARMGEDSKLNCCKIINVGLSLPEPEADPQSRNIKQRLELRDTYRKQILPALRDFDPDLIFISAGFDAHRKDSMNFGYVGMVEDDYEWVTEQLVKIANTCCSGRVISVLEGGYKIHGGIVSPFARSVASHVRALVDGGRSRELYDPEDGQWESQFERHLYERRERKKEQEREQLRQLEEANRRSRLEKLSGAGETPEDPDAPSRKRRRNQVDYKELFKQMQQEGFAG